MRVIGWDIGGVNTKVAFVDRGRLIRVRSEPYELQRDPDALPALLRRLAGDDAAGASHAVTMTAELSQFFRTKREGVAFVLDGVEAAFPDAAIHVYTVDGHFVDPAEARRHPLAVAASNWAATAALVAREHGDAILVDIGTTTADIIPIVGGRVAARGHTDPERLREGELVYTGALRTPVEAIVDAVPYLPRPTADGALTPADGPLTADAPLTLVSAEGFALAGDVHLWRGDLRPDDYSVPTPDRRPATREFAGERLARIVCADRELLDERGIDAIARHVSEAQVARVAAAIARVRARHPALRRAVVTGLGDFIAAAAARQAGMEPSSLARSLGAAGARSAPAAAAALLLDGAPGRAIALVIKVGGALLALPGALVATCDALARLRGQVRVLVVPGGGPFADVVRTADREHDPGDDAAHWMAVLAMDQYAHLLAARVPGARLVESLDQARAALDDGALPILAPYRWLRAADPLPHAWTVTSDSIAAWVAGECGARRLVLVKPVAGDVERLVDEHFARVRPGHVQVAAVGVGDLERLEEAVDGVGARGRRLGVG